MSKDNNCFCCGAEMKRFETEDYIYHYCFDCNDDISSNENIIQNFAAEYETE